MKIKFTGHALKRFVERKLTVRQVLSVLKNPDIRTEEEESLIAVYRIFGSLALKVVYKYETNVRFLC